MSIYWTFLTLLVGFVLWLAFTPRPRPWAEIGKVIFGVGLFIFLWTLQGNRLTIP